MVNRDPDDPAVAQWEREHRAMSKRDRSHIRQAIAHGRPVAEPRLTEAAEKGAKIVQNLGQECLAATHFQWWVSIAGLLATGATIAVAVASFLTALGAPPLSIGVIATREQRVLRQLFSPGGSMCRCRCGPGRGRLG